MTMQEDAEALLLDDDDVASDVVASESLEAEDAIDEDDPKRADVSDDGPDVTAEDASDMDESADTVTEPLCVVDLDDLSDIEIDDLSDLDEIDDHDAAPAPSSADRLRDNVLDIEDRRVQLHQIREARKRVRVLTPLFGGFGAGLLIGRMASGSTGLLLTGAILFLLLAAATWAFGIWLERTMRHDAGAILEQLDDTNRQLDEVLSRAAALFD